MPPKIYLTTTLPYVNADPHIGFAFEIVTADILARYHRLADREVFFNTGTDEHGLKIYRRSLDEKLAPQAYADFYAVKFSRLKEALNLSYDRFSRTTDPHHIEAAREFWRRCAAAGDIYKKRYQIKYCIGCELEKTDSELVADRCPLHPTQALELIEEENYFFKFSKYQDQLLKLYKPSDFQLEVGRLDFVVPKTRLNEIRVFAKRGLQDFSVSRLASKMPWGISVPDDDGQIMSVWFDALVNYVSALGWPQDQKNFEEWWPAIQFAGKDNLRQQAAMWPAMLMSASSASRDGSAGLTPPKQIIIHGFITSGGQKRSKSLGNVIDPIELVADYGTDAVRYFLARHVQPFEDTDVTLEKFKEIYNANLANGLGNLVSRVMKLASNHLSKPLSLSRTVLDSDSGKDSPFDSASATLVQEHLVHYELNQAMDEIWQKIGEGDLLIQRTEPFKLIKTNRDEALKIIADLCLRLYTISQMLEPFLPQTSQTILDLITNNQMPTQPLFPRK